MLAIRTKSAGVTPGKRASFKCDRNCVSASTKIREHIIAVAEKYSKLPDFITWYKRSKSGASITKMALGGAPKMLKERLVLEKDRIAKDLPERRLWTF